jgi:hypothetical protein
MARHPHLKVSGKHRGLGTFLWGFPIIALVWFAFSSVPVNADPPSDMRTMSVKERAELGEKLAWDRWGQMKTICGRQSAVSSLPRLF